MTGGAGTGGDDVKSESRSERAEYFIKKKVLVTFLTCLDFLLFVVTVCVVACFVFFSKQADENMRFIQP